MRADHHRRLRRIAPSVAAATGKGCSHALVRRLPSIAEMSWADALEVVVRDAADLSEKFLLFSAGTSCDLGRDEGILAEQARRAQRKCAQSGMTMPLTNRRSQPSQTCVWAEKLARLCDRCGAGLALDLGQAIPMTVRWRISGTCTSAPIFCFATTIMARMPITRSGIRTTPLGYGPTTCGSRTTVPQPTQKSARCFACWRGTGP